MYVYILRCSDDSFYTGVTNNLELRLEQHQQGINPGYYTFSRRPVKLVYHVMISDPTDAIRLEKRLKGWSRAKKIALIEGKFSLLPGLSECKNETHSKILQT